jgi:hypothetical protein
MSHRNGFGNDSHCVLLTHASETLAGTDPDYFTDSTSNHICYLSGSTLKDKDIYKFGNYYGGINTNGSWSVTGYSMDDEGWGYIKCTSDESDWDFESNDFSIDFWIYIVSAIGTSGVYGSNGVYKDNENYFGFLYDNGSLTTNTGITFLIRKSDINSLVLQGNPSLLIKTWYHIALTRHDDTFRLFFDGVLIDSIISSSYIMPNWGSESCPYLIGSAVERQGSPPSVPGSFYSISAHYDEFRISKGICRWTNDFTLPNREY